VELLDGVVMLSMLTNGGGHCTNAKISSSVGSSYVLLLPEFEFYFETI